MSKNNSTEGSTPISEIDSENPVTVHTSPHATTIFSPSPMNYLGAGIMFLICLLFMGYAPKYLFWVPLLPLIMVAWVKKSKTILDTRGITAQYLFKPQRFMSWDSFSSLGFAKSGKAYAVDYNAEKFPLPGISFNSLPALHQAAPLFISDPLTSGIDAQNSKVTVINREGYSVMLTEEEHDLWLAEQQKIQQNTEQNSVHDESSH